MPLDSISQLGEKIGGLSNQQSDIKQSMNPDESNAQFNFGFSDAFKINGNVIVSKYTYATDSFILDHPVQGCLDQVNTTPNMQAYYNLQSDFNDQIGTRHGSSSNVTFETGKINNCAVFNGTSSAAQLLQVSSYGSTIDICFWFYYPSTSTGTRYIFKSGVVYFRTEGLSGFRYGNSFSGSVGTVSTNNWHFVRMTYSNGNNLSVYIDNSLYSNIPNTVVTASDQIYIGYDGSANYFDSKIDEIYINNSITASSIIDSIYNSGSGLLPTQQGPYLLDGGYLSSSSTPYFPAAFPWSFGAASPIKTVLFTYSY